MAGKAFAVAVVSLLGILGTSLWSAYEGYGFVLGIDNVRKVAYDKLMKVLLDERLMHQASVTSLEYKMQVIVAFLLLAVIILTIITYFAVKEERKKK
jgi:hypothetical protein